MNIITLPTQGPVLLIIQTSNLIYGALEQTKFLPRAWSLPSDPSQVATLLYSQDASSESQADGNAQSLLLGWDVICSESFATGGLQVTVATMHASDATTSSTRAFFMTRLYLNPSSDPHGLLGPFYTMLPVESSGDDSGDVTTLLHTRLVSSDLRAITLSIGPEQHWFEQQVVSVVAIIEAVPWDWAVWGSSGSVMNSVDWGVATTNMSGIHDTLTTETMTSNTVDVGFNLMGIIDYKSSTVNTTQQTASQAHAQTWTSSITSMLHAYTDDAFVVRSTPMAVYAYPVYQGNSFNFIGNIFALVPLSQPTLKMTDALSLNYNSSHEVGVLFSYGGEPPPDQKYLLYHAENTF